VRHLARLQETSVTMFFLAFITGGISTLVMAQAPTYPPPPSEQPYPPQPYPPSQNPAQPPAYPPAELDRLVSRIALYPDPLLAQILAAATYPDQIPDAARYADEHHYLTGDDLARAIAADHLPWDPSVQALLPFPSVLGMMASDMRWTSDLGNAFLAQEQDVMDAVQAMRRQARDYGYLRSNGQVVVSGGPYITIMPVNPEFVCIPAYDPRVVYYPPRPGFYVGSAIGFGYGVSLGFGFAPWGWGSSHFYWDRRQVYIANAPWGRRWDNRRSYVHPYTGYQRWNGPRGVERHEEIRRSEGERNAARYGHAREEDHRGGHNDHRGGHDEHRGGHDDHRH
jgi:hypothetical protein